MIPQIPAAVAASICTDAEVGSFISAFISVGFPGCCGHQIQPEHLLPVGLDPSELPPQRAIFRGHHNHVHTHPPA